MTTKGMCRTKRVSFFLRREPLLGVRCNVPDDQASVGVCGLCAGLFRGRGGPGEAVEAAGED